MRNIGGEIMDLVIIIFVLGFLMFIVYWGFFVIFFVFLCVLFVVILMEFSYVLFFFFNIFMEKMVGFIKNYFLVFLLGVVFGKLVEMSGIVEFIVKIIINLVGWKWVILVIVFMCVILIYSGVSLFVVVFVVYLFVVNFFWEVNIFKWFIFGIIVLGVLFFIMDVMLGIF